MIGLNPSITDQEFFEVIEAVTTADTVEELIERSKSLVAVRLGSYHHIPSIGSYDYARLNRYWSVGITKEVHRYFEKKAGKSDPVMKFVLSKARPYWLSSLLEEDALLDGRSQHRIKLAFENVGDAIVTPLFGPFSKRGYAFIGFRNPREFYSKVFPWQVQALLQATHNKYCLLLQSLQADVKLTNREMEVLELISFGKTNPEIGVILGISTSTVSGYVKKIFLKFNATDRVTVALRARSLSL